MYTLTIQFKRGNGTKGAMLCQGVNASSRRRFEIQFISINVGVVFVDERLHHAPDNTTL